MASVFAEDVTLLMTRENPNNSCKKFLPAKWICSVVSVKSGRPKNGAYNSFIRTVNSYSYATIPWLGPVSVKTSVWFVTGQLPDYHDSRPYATTDRIFLWFFKIAIGNAIILCNTKHLLVKTFRFWQVLQRVWQEWLENSRRWSAECNGAYIM